MLAQAVGAEEVDGAPRLSLSCNSDLTLDLLPRLREREREGQPVAVLAQVNRELAFLYGDAMLEPDAFDAVLDGPALPTVASSRGWEGSTTSSPWPTPWRRVARC